MSRLNSRRVPSGPHVRVARERLRCDDCREIIPAGHKYVRATRRDYHVGCWDDEVDELEVFEEIEEERKERDEEDFGEVAGEVIEEVFGGW